MDVGVLTIGDELLAGDIENTNATWLARQLTSRGVTVARILVVPDDLQLIEETVREWSEAFDAVVVTGGLGGTHDDVTMDAVAAAFDRELVVDPEARADVEETMRGYRETRPELEERYPNLGIQIEEWASMPDGSRVILNPVGLCPGCAIEGVYVFPGIPEEMHAMFETVADDFGGDMVSEIIYTPAPEGSMTETIAYFHQQFTVTVGSYPSRGDYNRLKVSGRDADAVEAAAAWLCERIEVVDPEGE
ncbi:MAG: competence/damage-inducible protein A [Halobacteriota archaeon]